MYNICKLKYPANNCTRSVLLIQKLLLYKFVFGCKISYARPTGRPEPIRLGNYRFGTFFFNASRTINEWIYEGNRPKK